MTIKSTGEHFTRDGRTACVCRVGILSTGYIEGHPWTWRTESGLSSCDGISEHRTDIVAVKHSDAYTRLTLIAECLAADLREVRPKAESIKAYDQLRP